jgi:hypothetical protein
MYAWCEEWRWENESVSKFVLNILANTSFDMTIHNWRGYNRGVTAGVLHPQRMKRGNF